MSINDDLDDLPTELPVDIDDIIIKKPVKKISEAKQDANLSTIMDTIDASKTKFKLIDAKKVEIIDLSDLEDNINNEKVMSKIDALAVEGISPGLLDKLSVESFTTIPTGVNVDDTIEYIGGRVNSLQTDIHKVVDSLVSEEVLQYQTHLRHLLDTKIPGVLEVVSIISSQCTSYLEELSVHKDIIIPIRTTEGMIFKDLLSIDLTDLDILSAEPDTEELVLLCKMLQSVRDTICQTNVTKSLIHVASSGNKITLDNVLNGAITSAIEPITVLDLLRSFNGEHMIDFLESLTSNINLILTYLDELSTDDVCIDKFRNIINEANGIITLVMNVAILPILIAKLY